MSKFTFTELFAGIGGVSYGLERVGGKCLLAAEYDPTQEGRRQFAQESYKLLHPETPVAGDVFKLDASDVPDHDLLSFTFPCQSFSVAGNRGGFEDARGTLYFEAMRIAKEKRPKVIFAENVKGLVGHDKGKTLDTIVKIANDCGYRVDFEVLNSKYFRVAQNRERWFMVGIREDLVDNEPWRIDAKDKTVVPKGKRRISGYDDVKTFNFDWPAQEEVTTRLRDILEAKVDEKYYLSEEKTAALVAQLDEGLAVKEATKKGYAIANEGDAVNFQFPDSKTRRGRIGKQVANTLEASSINQGVVESDMPKMVGHVDIKGHDAIKRVYSAEGVSPTVTTMGGGHREPKIAEEVRPVLTPDRLNKRQNGRRFKADGDESLTLTSQDRHGIAEGVSSKYRIRKLTPLETFRLQAFPDEAHQALVDAGISNSQLYKQVGNAVTVNVIEAIGAKLQRYL